MYQSLSSSKDMIENQELTKDLFLKYNLQMIDTEKLAQKIQRHQKRCRN